MNNAEQLIKYSFLRGHLLLTPEYEPKLVITEYFDIIHPHEFDYILKQQVQEFISLLKKRDELEKELNRINNELYKYSCPGIEKEDNYEDYEN